MVINNRFAKIILPFVSQIVVYIVQYIVIINSVSIYPSDIEKICIVIISSTFLTVAPIMFLVVSKLRYWLLSYPLYPFCIIIYHPQNAYGIGYGMFAIESIAILLLSLLVVFTEIICWCIIRIIKRIVYMKQSTSIEE